VELAQEEGILCYRGSEEDVLDRLCRAALCHDLEYAVNITADCPLLDPIFIDMIIDEYERTNADLIRMTRLPPGQGPYGVKVAALEKVCELKDETETEVWGGYFTESNFFHYHDASVEQQYLCSGLKTTLDYPEDYEFMKRIFDALYSPGKIFSLADIIDLVKKKPELLEINTHCLEMGKEHIKQTASPVRFKKQFKAP
jgi:spore coat polysaccharide biosynthesis protein SpsF